MDKFFIKTCQQLEEEYLCTLLVSQTVKSGEANCRQMAKTHTDLKKSVHDVVVATTDNEVPFWESAWILLRAKQYLIANLEELFTKWKTLKKKTTNKIENRQLEDG